VTSSAASSDFAQRFFSSIDPAKLNGPNPRVRRRMAGGGSAGSDTVPALLTPGEYVVSGRCEPRCDSRTSPTTPKVRYEADSGRTNRRRRDDRHPGRGGWPSAAVRAVAPPWPGAPTGARATASAGNPCSPQLSVGARMTRSRRATLPPDDAPEVDSHSISLLSSAPDPALSRAWP
jgi:hypothetical protein